MDYPRKAHDPVLDAALEYHRRGWRIIPTRGKKAAGRWKRFQTERPSEDELRELFAAAGVDGLAVILGSASDGLACRDFDEAAAYHRWATANPELARTLPTVATARGFHLYFQSPDEGFAKLTDGEYRADSRHYCLLPPSRHPSGGLYEWTVPLSDALPSLNPYSSGLIPVQLKNGVLTHTQDNSRPHIACVSQATNEVDNSITEMAILRTLPDGPGKRNRKIFDLARLLKGIIPGATSKELREIVVAWHRRALPFIRTKDFNETWTDFVIAWEGVKFPWGSTWQGIIEEAKAIPPPLAAAAYDDQRMRFLVRLCACLERYHGGRPWPLSCRVAGEHVGVAYQTAARWLRVLCFEGVIEIVTPPGCKGSERATEYRYLA